MLASVCVYINIYPSIHTVVDETGAAAQAFDFAQCFAARPRKVVAKSQTTKCATLSARARHPTRYIDSGIKIK